MFRSMVRIPSDREIVHSIPSSVHACIPYFPMHRKLHAGVCAAELLSAVNDAYPAYIVSVHGTETDCPSRPIGIAPDPEHALLGIRTYLQLKLLPSEPQNKASTPKPKPSN